MSRPRPLKSKRRYSSATWQASAPAWSRRCSKCERQCNDDGMSRDGLHECPLGGRHSVST